MDLEHLWYELSPYVYGIAGLVALVQRPPSLLYFGSGVLLVAASVTILRWRWRYRRALYRHVMDASVALAPAPPKSPPP